MLPNELTQALEKLTTVPSNHKQLVSDAKQISYKYRYETGKSKTLVSSNSESIAYAFSRMPATYESVFSVIKQSILRTKQNTYNSLLDVGAGTGAATWAANELLDIENITCLEKENSMIEIGKTLMNESELKNVEWKNYDLIREEISKKYDIVLCSYVLNELNDSHREIALKKMWNATKRLLIIVEPGTPRNFVQILLLKDNLIRLGANIIAPCVSNNECPLKDSDDWCNFSCRVARTKLHKEMKNGDAPFEDEKFTYLVASRDKLDNAKIRVIRHPFYKPKVVTLDICTPSGIQKKIITKSNKYYKKIRDIKIGDEIDYEI